ncbi:MAG: hypothetical protein PVJ33_17240 [Lysobacterales bacterium]|jgi:hypothetical protein
MKRILGTLIALVMLAFVANRYLPVFTQPRSLIDGSSDTQHPPTACRIKGNINMSGERIYHLPGQPYYDETRIDVARGERWFCSEEQARAAGWRKSRAY